MTTHSIAQPIDRLTASLGYVEWAKDLKAWIDREQNLGNGDPERQLRRRAARAALERALSDLRPLIRGATDEAA